MDISKLLKTLTLLEASENETMLTGNYTKLRNGTFGAWVNDDYTGVMLDALEPGTKVLLTTRRGEEHVRIVASEVKTFKSGHVVSLVHNQEITAKARERYAAKKAEFAAADEAEAEANAEKRKNTKWRGTRPNRWL